MKKSNWIWIGVVLIIIVVVWLAAANHKATTGDMNRQKPEQTAGEKVLQTATDAKLGSYLVASNGMTLYKYTKDTPDVTNCYDACAVNWPPYFATDASTITLGNDITGKVGAVERKDGTKQLTYNGMPLYFWKNDQKPGDTTGQNVGNVWFVVQP